MEFARDGESIEQVITKAKKIIGKKLVQRGVDKMIKQIIVEATFNDGLKTVKQENYKIIYFVFK